MSIPRDYRAAGSSVMPPSNGGGNVASGLSGSLSGSVSASLGTGRDSLVLLAALVVGVIALSYWVR